MNSSVKSLLQRLIDGLIPQLGDDDLDQLLTAVQFERGRRRQLSRRNPERINGA
jgi:hypothetical protein